MVTVRGIITTGVVYLRSLVAGIDTGKYIPASALAELKAEDVMTTVLCEKLTAVGAI